MEITPPFGLTRDELVLDPAAESSDLAHLLRWLSDDGSEAEVERILHGTVCLKAALPEASLADCLGTAIIWERG